MSWLLLIACEKAVITADTGAIPSGETGAPTDTDAELPDTDGDSADTSPPPLPASCLEAGADGLAEDGVFWIDPDGPGGVDPFEVLCDMTRGGWTLALLKNSMESGTYGDFAADWIGLDALRVEPTEASSSEDALVGWLDLNAFSFDELELVAYGAGKETYRSEAIPRSELRLAFGEDGYLLYGSSQGYTWCGGDASFTDGGQGQVDAPAGAPDGCKGHGSLGSGWDFSDTDTTNQGLTLCGADGSAYMYSGWKDGALGYGTAGAAYAIWVK